MKKCSIKDIARMAGVSPSAVSLALNNKPGVSQATRDKVAALVEQLNYIPNPNSRSLLLNKTDNIAVLSPVDASPLEHFFHAELNRKILKVCQEKEYNLIYTSLVQKNGKYELPKVIRSFYVDGIISYGDIDPVVANGIKEMDIPYVLVDSHSPAPNALNIQSDYFAATTLAMEYLYGQGHRDIAYLGSNMPPSFSHQTFGAYKEFMEQHDLTIPFSWISMNADDEQKAYDETKKLISCEKRPTAIMCNADVYSISAVKCVKDSGMRVPDDISVIGIDDIILGSYIDPPLTTVRINIDRMANMAVEVLVNTIEKKADVENMVCTDHELIIRSSVSKIPVDH